jgi:hypothetical protein
MGPTRWPVDIHLADITVGERQATSRDGAGRSEHLKALHYESQGTAYTPKIYEKKSHQPRILIDKQHITYLNDNALLPLKPTALATYPTTPPPTTLLDNGASSNFTD